MSKNNIKTSGFSLAKRKELTGDDFYEIKQYDDMTIAVLCDGVGSAQEGALAAKRVTLHIINNFKNIPKIWSIEKAIKEFINSINSILYTQSIHEYERPEYITTITVVVIKGNRLYGANAGDSRIYLLRDNKLNQLSYDHNEDGMPNVLSNAIGISPEVQIHYFENNIDTLKNKHKNQIEMSKKDLTYLVDVFKNFLEENISTTQTLKEILHQPSDQNKDMIYFFHKILNFYLNT